MKKSQLNETPIQMKTRLDSREATNYTLSQKREF